MLNKEVKNFLVTAVVVFIVSIPATASGNLVWSTSGYTAGNLNGNVPSTDPANTTTGVIFQVTNSPVAGMGQFVGGSPAVTTDDFATGGLLIDYAYRGAPVAAFTTLDPDMLIQGVQFTIGDLDSNNTALKQDGVIVSATNAAGMTIFPTITLASTTQLIVSGTPGEVFSSIAPNRGQDDTRAQAYFDFGLEWIDSIQISFLNYGTATADDNHWGVGDITWSSQTSAIPEPSTLMLTLVGSALISVRRRRLKNSSV